MKKNITMTINQNTINNRLEIVFSEKPSKKVLDAIKAIKFVYRNIDGQALWLCTAKYLVKEDYNLFINETCKDFKKVVKKDGKAIKKAVKKAEPKQEAPKTDRVAELEKQIAELTKAVQALTEANKPTAKKTAKKTTKQEAPKPTATAKTTIKGHKRTQEIVLTVNGKVIR